jgi:hypothetical protein
MTYAALGGRHTAKRRIQIRQYLAERTLESREYSNPFVPDDDNPPGGLVLNVRPVKLSFRTAYVPDEETEPADDILSPTIDLDEADRFISVLRIPNHSCSPGPGTLVKPRVLTAVDLATFQAASERLDRLQRKEAEDTDDSEEDEEDEEETDFKEINCL